MKRYKLVRIVHGREYVSANTVGSTCLAYKVGKATRTGGMGIACYRTLRQATRPYHIKETMSFNGGHPVAVLEVAPIGEGHIVDGRYGKGEIYEGGVNYFGVNVLRVVKVIAKVHKL